MPLRIKSFFHILILILIIFLCSYIWKFIELPYIDGKGSVGALSKIKYNHLNDTLRYLFFIGLPLVYYLFFIYKTQKDKVVNFNFFFKKFEIREDNFSFKNVWPIFIFLILLLSIEFLSLKSPSNLDPVHDGDLLTPAINYLNNKEFWQSSFTIHGASDIFYPLVAWKLFGVETVGAFKVFKLILILILKILSIILIFLAVVALIHALIPFVFYDTVSTWIKDINKEIQTTQKE